ncbi:MAG: hypothetical protein Q9209_003247 [Squamulea sp. 1 TL-2023]
MPWEKSFEGQGIRGRSGFNPPDVLILACRSQQEVTVGLSILGDNVEGSNPSFMAGQCHLVVQIAIAFRGINIDIPLGTGRRQQQVVITSHEKRQSEWKKFRTSLNGLKERILPLMFPII